MHFVIPKLQIQDGGVQIFHSDPVHSGEHHLEMFHTLNFAFKPRGTDPDDVSGHGFKFIHEFHQVRIFVFDDSRPHVGVVGPKNHHQNVGTGPTGHGQLLRMVSPGPGNHGTSGNRGAADGISGRNDAREILHQEPPLRVPDQKHFFRRIVGTSHADREYETTNDVGEYEPKNYEGHGLSNSAQAFLIVITFEFLCGQSASEPQND